jgi:hypothetical protein
VANLFMKNTVKAQLSFSTQTKSISE